MERLFGSQVAAVRACSASILHLDMPVRRSPSFTLPVLDHVRSYDQAAIGSICGCWKSVTGNEKDKVRRRGNPFTALSSLSGLPAVQSHSRKFSAHLRHCTATQSLKPVANRAQVVSLLADSRMPSTDRRPPPELSFDDEISFAPYNHIE
ncbi:hypothetical protein NDA11_000076 [Ustilago hordei]|uniref:Uncharacterized protein n=1 Tax=Ustilago hordei TaxID=120017 RepID=I2G748_USTHO|nr:uncharacterized protein UHO2_02278 [Ustilago hordei]KAJ1038801.1 hypothetical protein NDA10_006217 [Ustilago hordei]KAJ1586391.1 hypothetical protein NDA12_007519 [Ustilago hordei]KAJ1589682.1 hypothetical protein NDA15_007834 [Ustilago hordei]KAJ1590507.1 hypothetical protein NDA11_000076 [Ustilago hordei]KAJ1600628.1 hypothetical protein NDA14_002062 [Ustilago hordei]